MELRDRVTQGFIAGVVGGIIEMIFTLAIYYGFGLIKYRYLDFAAVITFNHRPQDLLQAVVAELVVWAFVGFLGAFFVLMLNVIGRKNIVMKGSFWGLLSWLLIYGFVTVFRIEGLYPTNFITSVIHLIGGMLYGTVMAYTFVYVTKKYGLEETQVNKTTLSNSHINPLIQPVMKPLDKKNECEDKKK